MPFYLIVTILAALVGLLAYSVYSFQQTKKQLSQLTKDVTQIQQQNDVLTANRAALDADVDTYNQILTRLVPDTEDYFSIISALEKLSSQTGFSITKYTINVAASNAQKLSLTVEGNGDAEAFFKFLQDYRYNGERLITNGKIDFSTGGFSTTKLDLNFYNKKTKSNNDAFKPIATQDITLMQTISDKVNFSFIAPEDLGNSADYPTKNNPF